MKRSKLSLSRETIRAFAAATPSMATSMTSNPKKQSEFVPPMAGCTSAGLAECTR